MGDVLLTVAEGERILHDGHVYEPGESFKMPDGVNADTLLRTERCEKGKGKPTEKGPTAEAEAAEATSTSTGDADKPPKVSDLKKQIPDLDDQALAAALEVEERQDPQRKSAVEAIKAEQKKRSDAASG